MRLAVSVDMPDNFLVLDSTLLVTVTGGTSMQSPSSVKQPQSEPVQGSASKATGAAPPSPAQGAPAPSAAGDVTAQPPLAGLGERISAMVHQRVEAAFAKALG